MNENENVHIAIQSAIESMKSISQEELIINEDEYGASRMVSPSRT